MPYSASHRLSLAALAAACLLFAPAADAGLRCGGKIVDRGDRAFEVREHCGEPDTVVALHTVQTVHHGRVPTAEEWQYNFGPHRLMRFLVFRNNRLSRIRTGPHGFNRSDGNCRAVEISEGLSQLELEARCGEPREKELRVTDTSYRIGPDGPYYRRGLAAEDWIYDFGSRHFIRIVTLIHGRVVHVERSSSRGSS